MKKISRIAALVIITVMLAACSAGGEREIFGAEPIMGFDAPEASVISTPSPTPAPAPVFSFAEDKERALPTLELRLEPGQGYSLGGVVTSNYPLTAVYVTIDCYRSEDEFYPYEESVSFDPAAGVMSYDLTDAQSTLEKVSLNAFVQFGTLGTGKHTLRISARSTGGYENLATAQFYVLSKDWEQLDKSFFTSSYENTLKFFEGDKEAFLFRFQRVWDRYLIAEPEWEQKYMTKIDAYGDAPWDVHLYAKKYFESAVDYISRASFRVSGTNGDTGVRPLSDCVLAYNGSYVPRFITGTQKISLHSFGTAIDINSALLCNHNTKENKALIYDEVKNYLTYNGIKEQEGRKYYDFTYSGAYANTAIGVPETVINYLLYELAFYRAGFQWGHYYNTKSDAMHYTLTDSIGTKKHNKSTGLKKVEEYYD